MGAATAQLFAAAGAAVAVLDKDENHAVRTVEAITRAGGKAVAVACDVTREADVEEVFAGIVKELGGIDILVNNAGRAIRKPATEVPMAEWQQVIDLNLSALFVCSRIAARHMRVSRRGAPAPAGGSIVNLASIMGLSGGIFPNASYQASKGGVVNLTRALALEWAKDRIRGNAGAAGRTTPESPRRWTNRARSASRIAPSPSIRRPETCAASRRGASICRGKGAGRHSGAFVVRALKLFGLRTRE